MLDYIEGIFIVIRGLEDNIMKNQMHIVSLIYSTGLHPASWRLENSRIDEIGQITYQQEIAKIAERGCLDAIFLADGQYISQENTGHLSYFLEPITTLTAISQVTKHIGLIATVSSTFYDPYNTARLIGSLDHISQGRAGINIVTSQFDNEAGNHSMTQLPPLNERYKKAEEFVHVLKQLWQSFDSHALINDRKNGRGIEWSLINEINHEGEYFKVKGPVNLPSSPQIHPVLCQAGTSIPGRDFASKAVDMIFSVAWNKVDAKRFLKDIEKRVEQLNNSESRPLILPGLTVYVADTMEEAKEKRATLDRLIDVNEKIKQIEQSIGQSVEGWDFDAVVPSLPSYDKLTTKVVSKARYEAIRSTIETESLTLRELAQRVSTWMGHKTIVGDPITVADMMQEWFEEECCDGFTLMPPTYPDMFEAFIDKVIPILQERGLFRKAYTGTTLRENLQCVVK